MKNRLYKLIVLLSAIVSLVATPWFVNRTKEAQEKIKKLEEKISNIENKVYDNTESDFTDNLVHH